MALPAESARPAAPALTVEGVEVVAPLRPGYDEILTPDALRFLGRLHRGFDPTRRSLLARRRDLQRQLDGSWRPSFLTETADLRKREWKVRPAPADLLDRRVEITGPVDRKMVINALNSGRQCLHGRLRGLELPHLGTT